jgi:peroxiredoxin
MIIQTTPANNRWQKRMLRWIAEGVLLLLVLYLIHLWQTWDAIEGDAPPLTGNTLTGERFSLESQREKPLLIYFWATWCPICGISSESIDRLSQDYSVMTIAMQSGKEAELLGYLQQEKLNFPVIADPDGRISDSWRVNGVPTVYILDNQNRIRSTTVGYTTSMGLKARMWLAAD